MTARQKAALDIDKENAMAFKLTDVQELIVDSYRDYMESENWEA